MRALIVKLSSLGDVVHTMPVVADIRAAWPDAIVDWVVEPAFAPLLRRVDGIGAVIECALRRWGSAWWTAETRAEWRAFTHRLQRDRYDAVIDLQGLTKSAVIARIARCTPGGARYGLANRTDGASHEAPARWLVDRPIRVEPHIHALDRGRALTAQALGHAALGPPRFGLRAGVGTDSATTAALAPHTVVFAHGTSRADKLWPEAHWIALGRRIVADGWRVALPHAGADERARAERLCAALGNGAEVWPALALDSLVDRLAATQGVIGVDSGLSHIAVALDLPHVQLYNFPTAWRTGPQPAHGHRHQVSVEAEPTPSIEAVAAAWRAVRDVAGR